MKKVSLAPLTNIFSTVTTCKAFFMACRCFVVFEADGGILPILKAITCKFKIASALSHPFGLRYRHTHTHGKIQRHLDCGSGIPTRATWKTRTPGMISSDYSSDYQYNLSDLISPVKWHFTTLCAKKDNLPGLHVSVSILFF